MRTRRFMAFYLRGAHSPQAAWASQKYWVVPLYLLQALSEDGDGGPN